MARILLVDDHPDMREVVGQMLEMHGHTVACAESAEGAWEHLKNTEADAVVVDQRLPDTTGIDLLKRIRQTPRLDNLAVVLCSGDDTARDEARSAGAYEFWLKGSAGMIDAIAGFGQRLRGRRNFPPRDPS